MNGVRHPAKRAILIAGPTASGKSALAVALAERIDGEVVNIDAMQVYGDLRVLTARPTDADMARVPHHMFGHVDASDAYSVGRWLADLEPVLSDIERRNRVPVLVGGTGLYIKALTIGLSDIPDVPTDVRIRVRRLADTLSPAELHARLARVDPLSAARTRPTDPQRILRALEIWEATGRSLLSFHEQRGAPLLPWNAIVGTFLAPPRPVLNEAIDARFGLMMAAGAMDEVARISQRNLSAELPAMRAVGVSQLLGALNSPQRLESAIADAKQATRHYAKRQVTFARHQFAELRWSEPTLALEALLDEWRVADTY